MNGQFNGERFTLNSRYTHVYVEHHGRWQLVAQGTRSRRLGCYFKMETSKPNNAYIPGRRVDPVSVTGGLRGIQ